MAAGKGAGLAGQEGPGDRLSRGAKWRRAQPRLDHQLLRVQSLGTVTCDPLCLLGRSLCRSRLKPSVGSAGSPRVRGLPDSAHLTPGRDAGGRRALSPASLSHLSSTFCTDSCKDTGPRPHARNLRDPQVSSRHELFSPDCWVQLSPGSQKNQSWTGLGSSWGLPSWGLPNSPHCSHLGGGPKLFSCEPLRRVERERD